MVSSRVAISIAGAITCACSLGLPSTPDTPPTTGQVVQPAASDGGGRSTPAIGDVACHPEPSTDTRPVFWRPTAPRRHECGVTEMEDIGRCTANAFDLQSCEHMKAKYPRCWACAVSQLEDATHGAIIADTQLEGFWPNHAGCVATEMKDEACGKSVYVNDVCSLRLCDHCNSDGWETCVAEASEQCAPRYPTSCAGNALARCLYRAPNEEHYIGLIEYFCGG